MPYEYRKATPQERVEIRRQRIQNGYPLHAPPHPFRQSGYYLITAANYNHSEIMSSPDRRTEFETNLLTGMKKAEAEIAAWVILPNHYHILLGVEMLNQVSSVLQLLHGSSSHKWNLEDGLKNKRRVWYRYTDRYIRNHQQYYEAVNYIHYNPVKHGYESDVYAWEWSSLLMYEQDCGRDWLRETWKKYTPIDIGWE